MNAGLGIVDGRKDARIAGDFPKSGRPSVRQSRREARRSRRDESPTRFPNRRGLRRERLPLSRFLLQNPARKNQV